MPVQIQTPNPYANYNSLVDRFNEVAKEKGVDASLAVGDTGLSLTIGGDGGKTLAIPLSAPSLDAPAGSADPEALETISARLTELSGQSVFTDQQVKEVAGLVGQLSQILSETEAGDAASTAAAAAGSTAATGAAGAHAATSRKSILFDIYALLALMQEVAQEQRNAAREIRQQENQNIISQIQNQAAKQRWAAITGVIATAVICVVQVAAISYQTGAAGKASAAQAKISDTAGAAQANADLKTATKMDIQLAEAKSLTAEIKAKIETSPNGQQALAEYKEAFSASSAKRAGMAETEAGAIRSFDLVQQTRLQGAGLTDKAAIDANKAEVSAAEVNLTRASGDVERAQAAFNTQYDTDWNAMSAKDSADIGTLTDQRNGLIAQKDQLVSENASLASQNQTLDTEIGQLQQRNSELHLKENKTPEEIAEIDQNNATIEAKDDLRTANSQKIAGNEAKIAELDPKIADLTQRIDTRSEIIGFKQQLAASQKNLDALEHGADFRVAQKGLASIKEQAGSVQSMIASNKEFIAATQRQTMAQAKLNYYMAYGQMANSLVQGVSNWINASATEAGAYRQEAEENWNMVKEIFDQAQDLIRSVRQLMLQVLQTENQSIQSVISKI